MWISRDRFKYLERRIDALEQKIRCKEGQHIYRADISCSTGKPILICDACYHIYKNPTDSKDGNP